MRYKWWFTYADHLKWVTELAELVKAYHDTEIEGLLQSILERESDKLKITPGVVGIFLDAFGDEVSLIH